MKQTSITKLSEVYNNLNARYNGESYSYDDKYMADLIKEVIRAESIAKPKGSKFDIYNYVYRADDLRPVMTGVFHDEGWRVASDTHLLFAEKAEYAEEFEHTILKKDGSFVEPATYPKWRCVLPRDDEDGYKPYEFDAQKFYDWLEEKRTQYKTEYGKGTKFAYSWRVSVGPACLKAELFDKIVTAMKYLGATQLYVKDARRAVYAKTDKGIILLMPVIQDGKEEDILTLA